MKALKTIIVAAVIVLALTTVAMAGIQRLGGGQDASAAPAPTTQAAGPGHSVILSGQQFAALLHVVSRDRSQDCERAAAHTPSAARTQAKPHVLEQARTHAAAQTRQAAQTHRAETHHTGTHSRTRVGSGTHDGGHHGGCD